MGVALSSAKKALGWRRSTAAAGIFASDAAIHRSHDRSHVVGAAERQPDPRFNGLKLDKLTRSLMFGPPSTRRQGLSRAQAPPEAALEHVSTDPGAPLAGLSVRSSPRSRAVATLYPATFFSSLRLWVGTESVAKPYPRPRNPILVGEDHSSRFELSAGSSRDSCFGWPALRCQPLASELFAS